jgi:ATP/maltotriose-dependent transcriptional regulator MalT
VEQHRSIGSAGTRSPRAASSHIVDRPRLRAAASALVGGDLRCIAVWSGAGSGKTVLLDEWVSELTAAGSPIVRLSGGSLPVELEDELTRSAAEIVFLVDDLHRAEHAQADLILQWMQSTPDARLVVAGRFRPTTSLTHLAALGQLLELRTEDLAFTPGECARLAASHGADLSPELIDALVARTGGWATGLALAIPTLIGSPDAAEAIDRFVCDSRAIGDYLISEVLQSCTDRECALLLAAALEDAVPLDLVARVSGDPDAGSVLSTLADRHSLLSVTGDEVAFHPVLLNFLQAEARRRDADLSRLRRLHASRWFASHGEEERALRQATASGDADVLAGLLGASAVDLVLTGHTAAVIEALRVLPAARRGLAEQAVQLLVNLPFPDRLNTARLLRAADASAARTAERYWVTLLSALHVLAATHTDEAEPHIMSLRTGAARSARLTCFGLDLLCTMAEGWAALLSDQTREATDVLREVADSAHNAGYTWLALHSAVLAADAAHLAGRWEEAADIEDTMVARAHRTSGPLSDRAASAALIVSAGRRYQNCLPLPRQDLSTIINADLVRGALGMRVPARALELLDDLDQPSPLAPADELEELLRAAGRGYPRLVAASVLRLTSIRAETDDVHAAQDFARFAESVLGESSLEMHVARYLLDPPVRADDARERRLREAANVRARSWHPGATVGAWLLLASHAAATGRHVEADHRIATAVAHAHRFRIVRPFRARNDEGAALVLSRAGHLGRLEPFADLIRERTGRQSLPPAASFRPVRLTAREHEILKELPLHQSLSEIARYQHLSTNTIKTHVRSIYQKLGVAERSAAVNAARERGML